MIFPPILELSLLGVYQAGVPNQERILLRPTETVNLAQFGIMVAFRLPNGNYLPLADNFFWLTEKEVSAPSWIVVLTGEGQPKTVKHSSTGHPVHLFFWGRKQTIFNKPEIVPVVFQISTVLIGRQAIHEIPKLNQ